MAAGFKVSSLVYKNKFRLAHLFLLHTMHVCMYGLMVLFKGIIIINRNNVKKVYIP